MEDHLFEFIEQFAPLNPEEKQALRELDLFRSYRAKTILVNEGQRVSESFFVLKGCIRTYYLIDGEEKTTAFYTEGEPYEPLCQGENRLAVHYAECAEDCILSVSTPGMEAEMFEKFPKFKSLCLQLSESQLADSKMAFDQFKNSTPEERYATLIREKPDLLQRVPMHQIASYLGIKPESLSRIKKRMIDKEKNTDIS